MPKKKGSRKKEHSLKYGRAEEHIRHILEYRGGGSHDPKKYNRKDKHKRDWTREKDPVPFFCHLVRALNGLALRSAKPPESR